MANTATGLCRVTVVAPHTRMDVALPAHVPLAELQADLLAQVAASPQGEYFVNDGVKSGGWTLARLGEPPLDADLTPAQLGLVDGQELYFRPASDTAPAAVFDDVIDAIASAASSRAGRWQAAASRRLGLVVAGAAVTGGTAVAVSVGGPVAAAAVLTAGAVLLALAWALARAFDRPDAAVYLGLLGTGAGFVGGVVMLTTGNAFREAGAAHLLAGGCLLAVYAVVATVLLPKSAPLFAAIVVAAGGLVAGTALTTWLGVTEAAAAATVAAVAVAAIPALPMLSYRFAKLPGPEIPRTPQELRDEIPPLDGELALARGVLADRILTCLLGTCAAATAVAAVWIGTERRWPSVILAVILGLIGLLKSRDFQVVRQRLPLLAAGFTALAVPVTAWAFRLTGTMRLTVIGGVLLLVAAVMLVHGIALAGRRTSPVWGRIGDIVQVVLIVSVIPMTLWVWDAYWWIRA
ncbi:type VII secretion integral membrane protein EccD [Stackebrandtia albiflava]|uniref:Type VII secretion integral membrane protein EccD n=1 Tax=Stackebrandtia albiflava TaxID=406432 RepID=A0A562URX5_9ACTN|nr:type VII secretion integral membrane protein EccD [Stackebrandtia albiflava]TWJ08362.1 type VII secretion integral membrane protein EccD [Stackebrandtia albiflava]